VTRRGGGQWQARPLSAWGSGCGRGGCILGDREEEGKATDSTRVGAEGGGHAVVEEANGELMSSEGRSPPFRRT
jgi:hypothetical protein